MDMYVLFRWDCNQLKTFEQLGAVGLDVFPNELEVNPRLLEFANVTLLPHMGTETQDTQKVMEVRALTNLRDFLIGGIGQDLVIEYSMASRL
jgi:glyoxylate reductase